MAKTLRCLNNQLAGLLWPKAALWLKRFALSRVVRHEEVFDLVDQVLIQVVERLHVTLVAGVGGNSEQAIVAIGFTLLVLKSAKAADQPRRDEAADEGRLLHQYQYVDGVAVVS